MKPRQVFLLVIVIALGIFNFVRYERAKKLARTSALTANGSAMDVWLSYDKAAAQRDTPAAQFQPLLDDLRTATANVPQPGLVANAAVLRDVRSCTIWLQFYRQSIGAIHPDQAWRARSGKHVDNCVSNHADVAG